MRKPTAVGYIRTATKVESKESNSVENQEKRIKGYCQKNNINLTSFFIDSAQSGTTLNRPALIQMLQLIDSDKVSQVICSDVDRISKSTIEYIHFKNKLKKHNVELKTITQVSFDTDSQFINEILESCNVFYSRVNRKRRKGN